MPRTKKIRDILIAELYPPAKDSNGYSVACKAIIDSKNSQRLYNPPTARSSEFQVQKGMEVDALSTTNSNTGEKAGDWISTCPRLQLRSTVLPKNRIGFMLGTDPRRCDIILPSMSGASRCHCYLTFDANKRLILRDCSKVGTVIAYGEGEEGPHQSGPTWIIGGHAALSRPQVIQIKLTKTLSFRIVVALPTNPELYKSDVEFLQQKLIDTPLSHFPALVIQSAISTRIDSGMRTAPQGSHLRCSEDLGQGSCGIVRRVWDVGTGEEYIEKEITLPKHQWWWSNEVTTLRRLENLDRVVKLIAVEEHPVPKMLVLHVPGGNLAYQNSLQPLTVREAFSILVQALESLDHIHGQRIIHGDINPENILIKSREPLGIVLTGFQRSCRSLNPVTYPSTGRYCAPETCQLIPGVLTKASYTTAVDVWSLGLVMLEYGFTLPEPKDNYGLGWCEQVTEQVIEHLDNHPLTSMISILSTMLVLDPNKRDSAFESLSKALQVHKPASALTAKCDPEPEAKPNAERGERSRA